MANYVYDRESGFVTRKYYGKRGPKREGPIGTVSKSKELLINIMWEGVQITVRLAKLAAFLETGVVYERVMKKDCNNMNNKWDNLIPLGPEDTDGSIAKLNEESVAEFKRRKYELEKMLDDKKKEEYEAEQKAVAEHKAQGKKEEPVNPNIETTDEPTKKFQAHLALQALRTAKRDEYVMNHPLILAVGELKAKYDLLAQPTAHLNGLHTGIKYSDAKLFLASCEKATGFVAGLLRTHLEGLNRPLEKWEQDALTLVKLMSAVERNVMSQRELDGWLANYKWNDEPWTEEFGTMTVQMSDSFRAELATLENEYRMTEEMVWAEADEKFRRRTIEEIMTKLAS